MTFEEGPAYAKLTTKQKLFVDAYFVCDYNATKAVLQAGYKTTPENANRLGPNMARQPKIKAAIDERAEQLKKQLGIKPEYLLRKLKAAIEKTGNDDNLQAHLRAIELAMKHNGMFSEKVELTGRDGGAIEYEQKLKEDARDLDQKLNLLALRTRPKAVNSDDN